MFDDTEYRKAMDVVVTRFQEEMKKVRTGRAHPDMQVMALEKSMVH